MRLSFTVSAVVALSLERPSMALVFAALAIAWAIPARSALARWLGWDEAMERAQQQREVDRVRRGD